MKQLKLYLFSPKDEGLQDLREVSAALDPSRIWMREELGSYEALRGKLEGGQVEYVLLDAREAGRRFLDNTGEPDIDELLSTPLAQLEKRHILRVLASQHGNKTRSARILGIDTKTLYNKLKSYQASEQARLRRREHERFAESA